MCVELHNTVCVCKYVGQRTTSLLLRCCSLCCESKFLIGPELSNEPGLSGQLVVSSKGPLLYTSRAWTTSVHHHKELLNMDSGEWILGIELSLSCWYKLFSSPCVLEKHFIRMHHFLVSVFLIQTVVLALCILGYATQGWFNAENIGFIIQLGGSYPPVSEL